MPEIVGKKIKALPEATTAADTDVMVIEDGSKTRKIGFGVLRKLLGIDTINNNLAGKADAEDTLKLRTKLYQANINTGGQTTITLDYNADDLCAFLISVTGESNAAAVSGHLLGNTSAKPTSVYLANATSGGVNQWCYATVGYLYK